MTVPNSRGLRLKVRRIEAGLKQSDVAKATGFTQGAISSWECGYTEPSVSAARALADLLGTTVDDLFPSSSKSVAS